MRRRENSKREAFYPGSGPVVLVLFQGYKGGQPSPSSSSLSGCWSNPWECAVISSHWLWHRGFWCGLVLPLNAVQGLFTYTLYRTEILKKCQQWMENEVFLNTARGLGWIDCYQIQALFHVRCFVIKSTQGGFQLSAVGLVYNKLQLGYHSSLSSLRLCFQKKWRH